MRQSQLSLVDAVNSSISYAERVIPVDEAMIQQMKEGFENLRGEEEEEEEIARSTPPLVKPQYIGSLPDRPEICLLRVADDPFDAFGDPLPSPSLPTLTSLSLLRGDESLLFQQLLGVYDVPRQPLDSAIPIDESFPMLTAVERSKLSHSVLSAERLHLEQNIPAGRATFQQCMRLCGFVIKMGGQATAGEAGDTAAAPLHLVEVPSDSMIGIHDFLATVRKVWEDEEYLRCETVPVKGTTPGELPSCEWRVDGVRRLIREQATAAAKVRIDQMIAATRETGVEAQAGKMIDRLQALVKSKFASAAGESSSEQSGWTRLACPHDRPIAHRLTNHATKKQEA